MSTNDQVEAIKAYLSAATKRPVYDHDEAQALGAGVPLAYTIVYFSRRFGGNSRGDTRENDLRRLQTRPAAKTVDDVRLLEDRIAEAFTHQTVDVAGTLMHFSYETGGGLYERDSAGYYSDLTDWTC